MIKRRSDFRKLISHARAVWRQSLTYQEAKKMCKDPNRKGWFLCANCHQSREVIKIDHIKPIGSEPIDWRDFGDWLQRLNCPLENLQGLCADCHKAKTKNESRLRRNHD